MSANQKVEGDGRNIRATIITGFGRESPKEITEEFRSKIDCLASGFGNQCQILDSDLVVLPEGLLNLGREISSRDPSSTVEGSQHRIPMFPFVKNEGGVVVLSKLPITFLKKSVVGQELALATHIQVSLDKTGLSESKSNLLNIITGDEASRLAATAFANKKLYYRRLATYVRQLSGPSLLVGDFKIGTYSQFFVQLFIGGRCAPVIQGSILDKLFWILTTSFNQDVPFLCTKAGVEIPKVMMSNIADGVSEVALSISAYPRPSEEKLAED